MGVSGPRRFESYCSVACMKDTFFLRKACQHCKQTACVHASPISLIYTLLQHRGTGFFRLQSPGMCPDVRLLLPALIARGYCPPLLPDRRANPGELTLFRTWAKAGQMAGERAPRPTACPGFPRPPGKTGNRPVYPFVVISFTTRLWV